MADNPSSLHREIQPLDNNILDFRHRENELIDA